MTAIKIRTIFYTLLNQSYSVNVWCYSVLWNEFGYELYLVFGIIESLIFRLFYNKYIRNSAILIRSTKTVNFPV